MSTHPAASIAATAAVLVASAGGVSEAAAQGYAELAAAVREYVAVSAPVVALARVRVIDGTGKPPAEEQTILIDHGRIAAVGRAVEIKIPSQAQVLDLAGHTVIPGIVGVHNHTFYMTQADRLIQSNYSAPRLYLANGVTTIRTTGSFSTYSELNLKRAIQAGQVPGPRMHVTGPFITGGNHPGFMALVASPDAARRFVDYWAEEGVTSFKFYMNVSRATMKAAIDAAHARGLKLTGHLCSVTYDEAVAMDIDNLEHGFIGNSGWAEGKKPDECPRNFFESLAKAEVESEPVRATIRVLVERRVPITSTLAAYETLVPNRQPMRQNMLDVTAPDAQREYLQSRVRIDAGEGFRIAPDLFRKMQAFETAFVEAGGVLAAGCDPGSNGAAIFGFTDLRNYELLLEAGLTPVLAIRIMTLNGAEVLGVHNELGSITPGKIADLVVIGGNPAADPADIHKVTTVFKDGVGYNSASLIASVAGQVGIR